MWSQKDNLTFNKYKGQGLKEQEKKTKEESANQPI